MRMIGFVNDENDARRFCDYLLTQNVAAHAEQMSGGGWQVWVENDDQLDAGSAELAAFRADRENPKYATTGQAQKLRKLEYQADQRRRRNFRDVRTTLFAPGGGPIPVAIGLIGISVVVTLLTNADGAWSNTLYGILFFNSRSITRHPLSDIVHGQVWRLVTPIFIHGGALHLIFNALWMLDLGKRIEPVKGSTRFAALALGLAVLTCLAQAGWDMARYGVYVPFGGLSGVVAGLFGFAWMCGRYRPYERVAVSSYETGYFVGWLVICSFGFVGNIANAAHWAGLAVGMVLGVLPSVWKRR